MVTTDYTNGGVQSKAPTHKIIVSENGIKVEPIDKPTELPKYGKTPFQ